MMLIILSVCYSNKEWLALTHVVLILDDDRHPTFLDLPGDINNDVSHDAQCPMLQNLFHATFNDYEDSEQLINKTCIILACSNAILMKTSTN